MLSEKFNCSIYPRNLPFVEVFPQQHKVAALIKCETPRESKIFGFSFPKKGGLGFSCNTGSPVELYFGLTKQFSMMKVPRSFNIAKNSFATDDDLGGGQMFHDFVLHIISFAL